MSEDYSFSPERRIQRNKTIQNVFDTGDFYKGKYCHLFVGQRNNGPTKAAFVVSRKSAQQATDRNRVKRLMRESFRMLLPRMEEGWPVVLLATREVHPDLRRQDFDDELEGLFESAGILDPDHQASGTS